MLVGTFLGQRPHSLRALAKRFCHFNMQESECECSVDSVNKKENPEEICGLLTWQKSISPTQRRLRKRRQRWRKTDDDSARQPSRFQAEEKPRQVTEWNCVWGAWNRPGRKEPRICKRSLPTKKEKINIRFNNRRPLLRVKPGFL